MTNKQSFDFYRTVLWIWDLLSLNLVLYICILTISRANALGDIEYLLYFAAYNLSWMGVVYVNALYLSKDWLNFESFSKRTLKCYLFTLLLTLIGIFLYHYSYSRLFITISFLGFGLMLVVNRVSFFMLVQYLRSQTAFQEECCGAGL